MIFVCDIAEQVNFGLLNGPVEDSLESVSVDWYVGPVSNVSPVDRLTWLTRVQQEG